MPIYGWILIARSKEHLDEMRSYIYDDKFIDDPDATLSVEYYATINDPLVCKDGRTIGKEGTNLALLPDSYGTEEVDGMIEKGIVDSDSVARLVDLAEEEVRCAPDGTIKIKKAKYFEFYGNFVKYLKETGVIDS